MDSAAQAKHPMRAYLLDPSFGIPTDVTFQIMGLKNSESENGEQVMLGEAKGHKLILGMVSPVFRRGFFGPAKDTKDIITVKETTLEAFNAMLDYIYGKDIVWSGLSVLEMYDIVNLAEKYDLPGLMEEVKAQMESVPLTMEGVMEVADTAAQFTQFPTISDKLLLNCAKFVKNNTGTWTSLVQFAANHSGSGHEISVLKLMTLIQELKCLNCNQGECQDGKVLVDLPDMFIPGCKLAANIQNSRYWDGSYATYIFTVIGMKNGSQVNVNQDNGTTGACTDEAYNISDANLPTFLYKCK